jgi:hypothetical protein
MDAQELRNLQEAYMEVVENQQLDEASRRDEFTRAAIARNSGRKGGITFEPGPNWDPSANRGRGAHLNPKQKEKQRRKALRSEEADIYDIILSYLLDEGYAETLEAAETIMVNMSEEWRDSIVEEFGELDEASKTDDATRARIKMFAGKKGISFEPGPRWDASANRGRGAHLSDKQIEKQRRKKLRGDA